MTVETAVPAGYAIERVDLSQASDGLMAQVVALTHALDAEARPEDPPYPAQVIEARFRATSKLWQRSEWIALAEGRLIGHATFVMNFTGSNEHIREVGISVHPDHRRRGLGRALFAAGVSAIVEGEAKLVEWWTTTRVPAGQAVSERLRAKRGLHMRASQLDLASVDRELMDRWAAIEPAGHRLVWIDDDIPAELLEQALEAFRAINRMPREDLEMEDWKFTEETTRDWERTRKARGMTQWLILAIEEATGAAAGFTNVVFDRRYAHLVDQGGTAVDPTHQGRGIGKWMKAVMVRRILADLPQARFIRTENARTNAPMLAINHGMGFQLVWESDVWQLPFEDARRYVRR